MLQLGVDIVWDGSRRNNAQMHTPHTPHVVIHKLSVHTCDMLVRATRRASNTGATVAAMLTLAYACPYVPFDPIGQGSFGTVYRACYTPSGAHVALKSIPLDGDVPLRTAQIDAEVVALMYAGRHEHVVSMLDFFIDLRTASKVLVFEITERTLCAFVKEHGKPPFVVCQIIRQCLTGRSVSFQIRFGLPRTRIGAKTIGWGRGCRHLAYPGTRPFKQTITSKRKRMESRGRAKLIDGGQVVGG